MKSRLLPFKTGKRNIIRATVMFAVLGIAVGISWAMVFARSDNQTLLDTTLVELEETVLNEPQNIDARLAIAIAYAARGYNDASIEQFEQALVLDSDNQTAMIGLGRILYDENRLDEALEPLLQVVELNANNPYRRTLEQLEAVYYYLGDIHIQKKDYAVAVDYLELALEINPTDADALYVLGEAQERNGDFEKALISYQQAVRYVPDFTDAYRQMSEIYRLMEMPGERLYAAGMVNLATKDFDDAIRDLTRAIELVPGLAEAYQGLGMAFDAQGQAEEALSNYEKALELDPDMMIARLGLQRLGDQRGE